MSQRICLFVTGFFFWILLLFSLGASSGTCSSSSHFRFTTTSLSGKGVHPSLVTVHKYLILGSSSRSNDPRATAEDGEGLGYLRSPVSDRRLARSFGSRDGCLIVDSWEIGERSKAVGSPDLRVTV